MAKVDISRMTVQVFVAGLRGWEGGRWLQCEEIQGLESWLGMTEYWEIIGKMQKTKLY